MSKLPQILHHFVQKNHTVISMAVSINKLHLISKCSFFLRRGRKLGSYCQSASWKTALKHMTLCTRNYYKYNKKFIIIFDSRTFTRYAELFKHITMKKSKGGCMESSTSQNWIPLTQNSQASHYCLTTHFTIKSVSTACPLYSPQLISNQLHIICCLYLCLEVILHNTTAHNPQKKGQELLFVTGRKNIFQYFTFISLNHMHPHLASHAAFLFSFWVLLPTHKKQNVILKIILIEYNVQIEHNYVMSFL